MRFKRRSGTSRPGLFFTSSTLIVVVFFQGVTFQPPESDHAKILRSLNNATLKRGKEIYHSACVACHGTDGTASLPQARSFSKDRLRFGNKPYDMWKTITYGAGMMAAQTWLNPSERYYVIQYIREEFVKKSNPRQYFKITEEYLSRLPKSQKTIEQQLAETKREALKGSLKHGQEWFMHNKSDYGYAIHSQLKDNATAALTVLLDENILVSYNLLRMGTVAAWQGKLNVSDTKYNRYRGEGEPFIEGKEMKGLDVWQWTYNGQIDSLNKTTGVRSPLPEQFLKYHGHYKNGKDVILSYSIGERKILEHPAAIKKNNQLILSQTLHIGPGKMQKILIGHVDDSSAVTKNGAMSFDGVFNNSNSINGNILVNASVSGNATNRFIAAGVISEAGGIEWDADRAKGMTLTIPASTDAITLTVFRTAGKGERELQSFATFAKNESGAKSLPVITDMIRGGPAWWTKKVKATGKLNAAKPHFDPKYFEDEDKTTAKKLVKIPSDYPYTVDNIGLPFNNAYNAWIRPTALDFMSDGRLVFATYLGDVWLGTGIDSTLNEITWQRIATGLYEPMGMKVINDKVHVTNRNGITILRDLNGDNETDFYENFHSDHDVSAFFHAFNFGLETDREGNFYYVKPGQYTNNKDPGNVIKVSRDGKKWESLATGFRVNNGVTITPDDRIFVSDNQGNWTPANKINYIQKGKFYGYVPNVVENNGWSPDGMKIDKGELVNGVISPAIVPVPDTFQAPALWMPQEFDNSPGGGVWSDKDWGPLGNHLIHTSYGTGWMYYFLPHEVDGVVQAAMVAMPFQFEAGIQRAVKNPVDKQIYTTGLTGWDDGVSSKYGVLSRVRYKGGQGHLLKDAEVIKGGIRLKFNFKLDTVQSAKVGSYEISQWNYKRTNRYGSAHYSVKNPGKEGQDDVAVSNVLRNDDGTEVILGIPEMTPVHTMRIRYKVKGADGTTVNDVVYLTINKIPE